MFERFRAAFRVEDRLTMPAAWETGSHKTELITGFDVFSSDLAGKTFDLGIYRTHTQESSARATKSIAEEFPEYSDRILPFGFDWLGRQFASDFLRVVNGEPQVLLFEPGTGEVLEIPVDFIQFHENELVDESDAALASGFFDGWARASPDSLPLSPSQCVGYETPLFLGGEDALTNLAVTDLEVYWSISAQLWRGVRGLPADTSVSRLRRDS